MFLFGENCEGHKTVEKEHQRDTLQGMEEIIYNNVVVIHQQNTYEDGPSSSR